MEMGLNVQGVDRVGIGAAYPILRDEVQVFTGSSGELNFLL